MVVPFGTLLSVDGSFAARARSTMLIPPTGWMKPPTKLVALAAVDRPIHAEFGRFVGRHFDDDRFDQNLSATDVEFVDHGHQRVHRFGGRGDHERVGGGVGPDDGVALGGGAAAPAAPAAAVVPPATAICSLSLAAIFSASA
jgi:hypothetical protein